VEQENQARSKMTARNLKRRSFIKGIGVAGAALSTGALLGNIKLEGKNEAAGSNRAMQRFFVFWLR
jgi:hypothetical protein